MIEHKLLNKTKSATKTASLGLGGVIDAMSHVRFCRPRGGSDRQRDGWVGSAMDCAGAGRWRLQALFRCTLKITIFLLSSSHQSLIYV
jgi:hypothetical protein